MALFVSFPIAKRIHAPPPPSLPRPSALLAGWLPRIRGTREAPLEFAYIRLETRLYSWCLLYIRWMDDDSLEQQINNVHGRGGRGGSKWCWRCKVIKMQKLEILFVIECS